MATTAAGTTRTSITCATFAPESRTRIAHCEPVHDRRLAADHADHATPLKMIAFISSQTADRVRRCDRIPKSSSAIPRYAQEVDRHDADPGRRDTGGVDVIDVTYTTSILCDPVDPLTRLSCVALFLLAPCSDGGSPRACADPARRRSRAGRPCGRVPARAGCLRRIEEPWILRRR
jgi:hypothetical protein